MNNSLKAPCAAANDTVNTQVSPSGSLDLLSRREVAQLSQTSDSRLLELFRRCALAVLNTGSESDDAAAIFARYANFSIEILERTRGVKLKIKHAPASAFVGGHMIEGVRQHLFAVLRDLIFIGTEIEDPERFDLDAGGGITDAVFHILRHARVLTPGARPNLVVCWGGHAISRSEYDYTKEVGYHLGLRALDICTGCGPGAMKGPMKGAAIGHAKQRVGDARYVGLTEPGIIAAEPPNPMVNHLVVLPDIEKRLEAFVRLGHGIIVFPGGVGTAEEILFLLGLLMHPDNADQRFPIIFTGPRQSADYFARLDELITVALGEGAKALYEVIIEDPEAVADQMARGIRKVRSRRRSSGDAYHFNWLLKIPRDYQQPFEVNHAHVAQLVLHRDLPGHQLAGNLRRVFSAIVTGNVKDNGIRMIAGHGPFEIRGDRTITDMLDRCLTDFVKQGRMKLPGPRYVPCYRVTPVG